MRARIIIEDHVVPQLLTSAIEAYEVDHKSHANGKAKKEIETYGLLWGHMIPERHGLPRRVVCTMATVETSALRHENWVRPQVDSLLMKRDFFKQYWPQLELVGTFHSHPYSSLAEVNDIKGWRASDADKHHWPWVHQILAPDLDSMAHLIVTVTQLERRGSAWPQRLANNESDTGFVLSSDWRKFWIKAYSSEKVSFQSDEDLLEEELYEYNEKVILDIPSLIQRFKS